jgi:hypothetical protein
MSLKDWLLFLIPLALGLASLKPDDTPPVFVLLSLSALGFIVFGFKLQAHTLWRILVPVVAVCALSFLGYRDLHKQEASRTLMPAPAISRPALPSINQNAKESPCANYAAGGNISTSCDGQEKKGKREKATP